MAFNLIIIVSDYLNIVIYILITKLYIYALNVFVVSLYKKYDILL